MKPFLPLKATVIDDDAFRMLAIPFGGPIPSPLSPRGVDRVGQFFSERTDIHRDWFDVRLVDWHHRGPGYPGDKVMGGSIVGKAILDEDLTPEEGHWITVWLKHGERRVELIKTLAAKGAQLFGSSETIPGMPTIRTAKGQIVPWRMDIPGEIINWPYVRQTISTSPENTYSVLRPLKATLSDMTADGFSPTASFFADLASYVDDLATRPSGDLTGEPDAKAGRILAARNEDRLRDAVGSLNERGWNPVARKRALRTLQDVLDELEKYVDPSASADRAV